LLEKSSWTQAWTRPKGRTVRVGDRWERLEEPETSVVWFPMEIPALWRRAVDTPLADVVQNWGPLRDYDEPVRDWERLHALLRAVSLLWSEATPIAFGVLVLRRDAEPVLQDLRAEVRDLRVGIDLRAGPHIDGLAWEIEPISLRAMLLLDAGEAVRQRLRYQRCAFCTLWFSPSRSDQRFCSETCRKNAFQHTEPSSPPALAPPELSLDAGKATLAPRQPVRNPRRPR
jgi:hypothetical protein